MCESFQDSNLSEQGQKYPYMSKISTGGPPVSSINSEHIIMYIRTSINGGGRAGDHADSPPFPSYDFNYYSPIRRILI